MQRPITDNAMSHRAGPGEPRRGRLDVTVVLLDDGHASTGIVPVEVFDATSVENAQKIVGKTALDVFAMG